MSVADDVRKQYEKLYERQGRSEQGVPFAVSAAGEVVRLNDAIEVACSIYGDQPGHKLVSSGQRLEVKKHLHGNLVDDPSIDLEAEEGPGPSSAAGILLQLALGRYRLGVDPDGHPYAVDNERPGIAVRLKGRNGVGDSLAAMSYEELGEPASSSAIGDVVTTMQGLAQRETRTRVDLRVAETTAGAIVVDHFDPSGDSFTIIDAKGKKTVDKPPAGVVFYRTEAMLPLPLPKKGGDLNDIFGWVNVPDDDRRLILAWLVSALQPQVSSPILAWFAEQGSGKTTAAKLIGSLVDPSAAQVRAEPRDHDDWVVAARASWVVALDNLSNIPMWLSNSLCRAVSGEASVKRSLFTDMDVALISFKRSVMLTAIDPGDVAGDLAERLLKVELESISEDSRRGEAGLIQEFAAEAPKLVGALFDVVVQVLGADEPELTRRPRLADFGELVATLDDLTGATTVHDKTGATIRPTYDRFCDMQAELAGLALESNLFASALLEWAQKYAGEGITMTAGQLLEQVDHYRFGETTRRPKNWPDDARTAGARMKTGIPALRRAGLTVKWDPDRRSAAGVLYRLRYEGVAGAPPTGQEYPSTPSTPSTNDPKTVLSAENADDSGPSDGDERASVPAVAVLSAENAEDSGPRQEGTSVRVTPYSADELAQRRATEQRDDERRTARAAEREERF